MLMFPRTCFERSSRLIMIACVYIYIYLLHIHRFEIYRGEIIIILVFESSRRIYRKIFLQENCLKKKKKLIAHACFR